MNPLRHPLTSALLAAALLAAPALASDDHAHHDEDSHVAGTGAVELVHAWVRAGDDDTTLLFVEIENASDRNVTITGGESDIATSVELVGFRLKDGETVYEPLPQVPVRAGTTMTLAPNGLALRLNGVTEPMVEGDEHEIEIEFDFGHVDMHFQVEPADATRHSHAGHQH
ncbi:MULTISPECIES: copper chaperone PCu(A)C [unclassified Roseitalea]|uniref:copper chaperone PCu(A)C n=1 Tax=unclassified Roseitalea TaxID=2639107 RepID=UPI00273EBFC2|nr:MULTISPECIES: copper chaperone PCu(A)C [unclassified Roseitalea]